MNLYSRSSHTPVTYPHPNFSDSAFEMNTDTAVITDNNNGLLYYLIITITIIVLLSGSSSFWQCFSSLGSGFHSHVKFKLILLLNGFLKIWDDASSNPFKPQDTSCPCWSSTMVPLFRSNVAFRHSFCSKCPWGQYRKHGRWCTVAPIYIARETGLGVSQC